MIVLIQVLAIVAAVSIAVIFGTDVLGALVMRPTYAAVDDATMVRVTGSATATAMHGCPCRASRAWWHRS